MNDLEGIPSKFVIERYQQRLAEDERLYSSIVRYVADCSVFWQENAPLLEEIIPQVEKDGDLHLDIAIMALLAQNAVNGMKAMDAHRSYLLYKLAHEPESPSESYSDIDDQLVDMHAKLLVRH